MKRVNYTKIEFENTNRWLPTNLQNNGNLIEIELLGGWSDGREHDLRLAIVSRERSCDKITITIEEQAMGIISGLIQKEIITFCKPGSRNDTSDSQKIFLINFKLIPRRGYCESAILVAHALLLAFGVSEKAATRHVWSHQIEQKSVFKFGEVWMSYPDYLRRTMPLFQVLREQ